MLVKLNLLLNRDGNVEINIHLKWNNEKRIFYDSIGIIYKKN